MNNEFNARPGTQEQLNDKVEAEAKAKTTRTIVGDNVVASILAKFMDLTQIKAHPGARSHAGAVAEVLTPLYDVATDCLRFSMYFFHPIQQCAQQVYHTAVPLSPVSSQLHKFCIQSVINNQLSHVTAFMGAPRTWGLILRTIDVRPRQLTCIATSSQRIIAACEDIIVIYDVVTGVPLQSLHAPEPVTKIQDSPDGSILFFMHLSSATMWDVQTGGLIYTFTTQFKINDITVSESYIACGLADGTVIFWDVHTKKGKCFGNCQPVVAIYWLSPQRLAVATQSSFYIHDITDNMTSPSLDIPGKVWGMVYLGSGGGFLVGVSGTDEKHLFITNTYMHNPQLLFQNTLPSGAKPYTRESPVHIGKLSNPTLVGNEIMCITPANGVQLFNTWSYNWTSGPLVLGAATSVAVSLNRNLVVQTKDSIQIFSSDVVKSDKAPNDTFSSHVYPLGKEYIVCLQTNKHLTLLKLETLQEVYPDWDPSLPGSLPTARQSTITQTPLGCGLIAGFSISVIMKVWRSGTSLPEQTEAADEGVLLSGLSPEHTRIAMVYSSPQLELCVEDVEHGTILANLPLKRGDFGTGKVYDLVFDSETRFHLKVDGPGWHVQIPHEITLSPSEGYSHTITRGDPVPLSEPRAIPPYKLDLNCEWVIDAKSRKICWIPPGNLRRGDGGHFWAGLSLVMVGDDGVVRKLSFRKPDC